MWRGTHRIRIPKVICYIWVKKALRLLDAVTERYCPGGLVSLEGDLSRCDFSAIRSHRKEETDVLKRQTISPVQDFVVMPLERDTIEIVKRKVFRRVGIRRYVDHIQMEKAGRLVFAAYDQFVAGCVWIEARFGEDSLRKLVHEGVISRFEVAQEES